MTQAIKNLHFSLICQLSHVWKTLKNSRKLDFHIQVIKSHAKLKYALPPPSCSVALLPKRLPTPDLAHHSHLLHTFFNQRMVVVAVGRSKGDQWMDRGGHHPLTCCLSWPHRVDGLVLPHQLPVSYFCLLLLSYFAYRVEFCSFFFASKDWGIGLLVGTWLEPFSYWIWWYEWQ